MRHTDRVHAIENGWSARNRGGIFLSISRAMSWLGTCIVEGFAAYAEAMHPCLVDRDNQVETEHQGSPVPWALFTSPWEFDAALMRETESKEW
jgi:hypothetical protein